MRGVLLLSAASAWAAAASAASAATGDPLPALGAPTYARVFDQPASASTFASVYPGLATWAYFGDEPQRAAYEAALKRPLTQAERFSSRTWPGLASVDVDPDYCPGAITPKAIAGALHLDAYRLTPGDARTCGQGVRGWASAYVSSQPSFAQTFGYFEADVWIPCDPGRWPAFWLLPTAKTPANGGRLAEIDVFEHYGGPVTVLSGPARTPVVISRVGQPISTLHHGAVAAEISESSGTGLPAISATQRASFCAARHRIGVLWTPQAFSFYVDRKETFRTPNPGVADPHYWIVNMGVSAAAGDPDAHPAPDYLAVFSVRAWALP